MGRDRVITDTKQFVSAAFKIIDEQGFDSFSARKLAEVLGISHMTVYNYMGRDALLNEVILMGFEILNAGIVPFSELYKSDGGDPRRIFMVIAKELLRFAQAHQNIYRFMFQNRLGLQHEDLRVRRLYSGGINFIKDVLPDEEREKVQGDTYLFIVLINGLILGYLGQRHSVTDEQCLANIARAYELILGHHDGSR